MIKNQIKTSKKSDSWGYPSLAESWREDFVKLIPRSKRRKELIKYVDLVDWERIGHLVLAEIKAIMIKIDIPERKDALKLNSSIVEAIILANIKKRLHYLFLHCLSGINKNDTKPVKNRKIKSMLSGAEYDVKYSRSIFNTVLSAGSLKWIKDSSTKQFIIKNLKKEYSEKIPKLPGKKYHPDNLKAYKKILRENDKFILRGGDGNYSEAARIAAKKYKINFKRIYRSFIKFKNKEKVFTYKDYESFYLLYSSR